MNKLKSHFRSRMPSVPKELIWQQVIHGTSKLPISDCMERIENMETRWYLRWYNLRPISIYPLILDANEAEFVLSMKISNGVNAWLFAELRAETSTLTRIEAEVGVDRVGILHFVLFGSICAVISVLVMLMTQNLLGLSAGLLFFVFFWLEIRWAIERQLVKWFQKAVGLDRSN